MHSFLLIPIKTEELTMLVNKSKSFKSMLLLATGLVTFAVVSESAFAVPIDANYFVRPFLQVGSAIVQDGLQTNGPIEATQTQNLVGSSTSTVNLAEGTVKMYAEVANAAQPILTNSGVFGERLTIQGGQGTNWNMDFTLDGSVTGDLGSRAAGSPDPFVFYNMKIAVFEAGVADYSNFWGIATNPCWGQDPSNCTEVYPLNKVSVSESIDIPYDPAETSYFLDIYETISASVLLLTNNALLDLFVSANVAVVLSGGVSSGVVNYSSDFSNTAAFSQTFAPGVIAYSSSGQFLGLPAPPPPAQVPTPGTLAMLMIGLLGLMGRSIRSKKNS